MKRAVTLAVLAALAVRCGQLFMPVAAELLPTLAAGWRAAHRLRPGMAWQPRPEKGMRGRIATSPTPPHPPAFVYLTPCSGAMAGTPPSYVVSVAHQKAGTQPYPRGCNNRAITIAVGQGSSAVTCESATATHCCLHMGHEARHTPPSCGAAAACLSWLFRWPLGMLWGAAHAQA